MNSSIPTLLGIAVLLPLGAFFVNLLAGHALRKKNNSRLAAGFSMAAIVSSAVLSFVSLWIWLGAANHAGGTNHEALAQLQQDNAEHLIHLNSGHSDCLLYTSPSPRDKRQSRMPSSA